jgi:hypothetical protein
MDVFSGYEGAGRLKLADSEADTCRQHLHPAPEQVNRFRAKFEAVETRKQQPDGGKFGVTLHLNGVDLLQNLIGRSASEILASIEP